MDKIQKALKELNPKERLRVKAILSGLTHKDFQGLNIQKLKGHQNIFRVRKGNIRIIYRQKEKDFFILAIERRSEKTYKNL